MLTENKTCCICSSNKHVDDHHYDCLYGMLSPETVPLCRRCHRTYHDLGVDYFDDEYLDKAIELENRRRKIHNCNIEYLKEKGLLNLLPALKREDIRRSAYWYRQHGISTSRLGKGRPSKGMSFRIPNSPALCGEDWLREHLEDHTPEEIAALAIEIGCNDGWLPPVSVADKRGKVKAVVRGLSNG